MGIIRLELDRCTENPGSLRDADTGEAYAYGLVIAVKYHRQIRVTDCHTAQRRLFGIIQAGRDLRGQALNACRIGRDRHFVEVR